MKKIFLVLLVSFFLFPSCQNIDPILSDVCEITEEICYYANLVCENFNSDNMQIKNSDEVKKELQLIAQELKTVNVNTSSLSPQQKIISKDKVLYDLIEIRDRLKEIYNSQQKLE